MKVIQGTFRSDRHGKEPAGKSTGGAFPAPPKIFHLSGREKQIWAFVGKHFAAWTQKTDVFTIWRLVRLVERLIRNHEAQVETDTSGHPLAFKHTLRNIPRPGGRTGDTEPMEQIEIVEAKSNPLIDQELRLSKEIRPFLAAMGGSPVDRARMPNLADQEKPVDPIAALQKRSK